MICWALAQCVQAVSVSHTPGRCDGVHPSSPRVCKMFHKFKLSFREDPLQRQRVEISWSDLVEEVLGGGGADLVEEAGLLVCLSLA